MFPAVAGRVAGVAAGRRGSRSGSWAATPSGAIATVAVVWVPQIFTKNVKPETMIRDLALSYSSTRNTII